MLELSEEEVKARAAAAQQEHMASNDLLTQVHTLGGDAQSRWVAGQACGHVETVWLLAESSRRFHEQQLGCRVCN
jgi:hypothetical protein